MNARMSPCRELALVMMLALCSALLLATSGAQAAEAPALRQGLVVQDTALRGAPREAAPIQAQLSRGEAVELRAERGEHWQVWDYRRERGGWLRKSQVMLLPRGEGAPAELLAQLRLARQQWGTEGLALGLASAYVQAATPAEMASAAGAEALDTLGSLAERIAERASLPAQGNNRPTDTLLAQQMDVATRYGLHFNQIEAEDGRVQVCYDGDVFRRVLALPAATAEQRLRAALAVTRPECAPARATPRQALAHDTWRAQVLALVDGSTLPAYLHNRLLMRRASVAASLAYAQARNGDGRPQAQSALADLGRVQPAELSEDDMTAYNDAAMRVNASRWLASPAAAPAAANWGRLSLASQPDSDGQTCVQLRDAKQGLLAQRCSFGLVALASASLNREANAVALSVQVLDGWRELWVFKQAGGSWHVDVLPPAAAQPGLGVVEFAGWVPGGQQMLVAREFRAEGRYRRSFEVMTIANLQTERQSAEPTALGAFQRWADAAWVQASPVRR